jgi:hypothetical protein
MSSDELLKIESFYRSYGTLLNIGGSCACLYTMSNAKTYTQPTYLVNNELKAHHHHNHHHNPKRSSFISSKQAHTNASLNMAAREIDTNILKDFMEAKHQNHVSVYHRGVPLWLFNSGVNPRRPSRQLKFTLAERGTGFILWQDRIDAQSDLKIYSVTKADSKLINYATYLEKIHELSTLSQQEVASKIEKSLDLFSSMLITFRASDKKTTVFIKFDVTNETAKFYDYYLQVIKRISTDIKQKTKSLPVGTSPTHLNQFNKSVRIKSGHLNLRDELQATHQELYFNYSKNLMNDDTNEKLARVSSNQRNNPKRRSFYFSNTPNNKAKRATITKSDISAPANPKHIININLFDRQIYYTLSKLIPESITKKLTEHLTNKLTPSPTSSVISSLSSHSSSILNTNSFSGGLTNSLVEGASIMLNPKSPTSSSQFSSSSSSSLLSMPHPILLLNASTNLKSNFFNESSMVMRNFEPMSSQRTVK